MVVEAAKTRRGGCCGGGSEEEMVRQQLGGDGGGWLLQRQREGLWACGCGGRDMDLASRFRWVRSGFPLPSDPV